MWIAFEEEELVDIDEVQRNIATIEAELAEVPGADERLFEGAGIMGNEIENTGKILIYQNEKGDTRIDVYFESDTIWMTQKSDV